MSIEREDAYPFTQTAIQKATVKISHGELARIIRLYRPGMIRDNESIDHVCVIMKDTVCLFLKEPEEER